MIQTTLFTHIQSICSFRVTSRKTPRMGLSGVAEQAHEELGIGVEPEKLVSHSVRVNVFRSMEFLLQFSEPLRQLVKSGSLEIQGGVLEYVGSYFQYI